MKTAPKILTKSMALLIVLVSSSAFAVERDADIRQIDNSKNLAVVNIHNKAVKAGEQVLATSKEKTQCSLTIRSVTGNTGIADLSGCQFSKELRVGQPLELSLLSQQPAAGSAAPAAAGAAAPTVAPATNAGPSAAGGSASFAKLAEVAPPGEGVGVTVFAFYDLADKFKGDVTAGGQSVAATENSESAFGLGAEYAMYNYRFPGFYVGGVYEFGRDWKSVAANGQTSANDPKPTLTLFLVDAGANFSVSDNIYVKGGVNYNLPSLTSGGAINDISGKLGYEGGVGVRFMRDLNIEGVYRKLNMSASGSSQGQAFNVDNLTAQGFLVRGGYTF